MLNHPIETTIKNWLLELQVEVQIFSSPLEFFCSDIWNVRMKISEKWAFASVPDVSQECQTSPPPKKN